MKQPGFMVPQYCKAKSHSLYIQPLLSSRDGGNVVVGSSQKLREKEEGEFQRVGEEGKKRQSLVTT